MKKSIFTTILVGFASQLVNAQSQLQSITSSSRLSPNDSFVTQDSLFNFYKPNNKSKATQINKIWTNSELILEPNYTFKSVLRTMADSTVSMNNGGSYTKPLAHSWSTANWYNADYTQLIKQHTYGTYSGFTSFLQKTLFYYTPTIDSNIFYTGSTPSTANTVSLRRFFYKSGTGRVDSIIDNYYSNKVITQTIKWNFKYNTQGNLIEWKYQNPLFASSNKLYKLFYTGSSNLVDSVQYYINGITYNFTYTYKYGSNNEWSTIAYKPAYNSSTYPNGIASYKNADWGTQVYCNSIDNFYYYPANQLNSNKTINKFNTKGYIESENNMYKVISEGIGNKTVYKYNVVSNIKNINMNNIKVYPNPTSDIINIELIALDNTPSSLYITDMLGKLVFTKSITELSTAIKVANFNKGIYFITIQSVNYTNNQKFIIN